MVSYFPPTKELEIAETVGVDGKSIVTVLGVRTMNPIYSLCAMTWNVPAGKYPPAGTTVEYELLTSVIVIS